MVRTSRRYWFESILKTALFGCLAINGYLLGFQIAEGSCTQDDCQEVLGIALRNSENTSWVLRRQYTHLTSTNKKMRSTFTKGGDPEEHQTLKTIHQPCDVFQPECDASWDWERNVWYKGETSQCGTDTEIKRWFCMDPETGLGEPYSWNEYEDSTSTH